MSVRARTASLALPRRFRMVCLILVESNIVSGSSGEILDVNSISVSRSEAAKDKDIVWKKFSVSTDDRCRRSPLL